ncbi:MAG: choice-of-anchor D domain-containing protein [Defluviicoccus sp.]|nr:choice-of-anchor D domain-containing protein [Defluviicoccus sp.]
MLSAARPIALLAALSCIGLPAAAQTAPEIAVLGNGVEIAAGSTRPSTANDTNFGDAALLDQRGLNEVVERTFTIQNLGDATLTLGADAVSLLARPGSRQTAFRVKTQPAQTVAVNGSTTFTIAFDPQRSGGAAVNVSIASDDADENPYRFRVGGRGVEARMAMSWSGGSLIPTGTVDFGELEVADTAATIRVVTVTNTGRYPLVLGANAVTVTAATAATCDTGHTDFSVDTQPDATVAPGASTTFTLAFDAAAPGARKAKACVAVSNELFRRPAVEIALQGEGLAPVVTVAAVADTVAEGEEAVFTLTRTRSTAAALTVGVTVSQEGDVLTATVPDSVIFAENESTATLRVATVNDGVDEADGVVTVTVDADTAYVPGMPASASVTVTDDEVNEFTIRFPRALYTVDEGAGSVTLEIEFVSASGRPPAGPVSVTVGTVADTGTNAALAGVDFEALSETVELQPGDFDDGPVTHELSIEILEDTEFEGSELFAVRLSDAAAPHESDSAILAAESTVVLITDNDLPAVTVEADAISVTENPEVTFTLERTGVVTEALTVRVAVTETGTMLDGTPPDSVTFQAGSPTAPLTVAIDDDRTDEDHSVVTVAVLADSAATPTYELGTPASASTTVIDDEDNEFTIEFAATSFSVAEDGGTLRVGISFASASNRRPDGPVSVTVATRDGSAQAGQDFTAQSATVELQPGDFNDTGGATHNVSISIENDTDYEGPETFQLVLTSPVAADALDRASLGTASATVTIEDDDLPAVTVAADAPSVVEGERAAFTLTRTGPVAAALTVGVAVSQEGDVLAPTDQGLKFVTFAEDSPTAQLSVPTQQDTVDEADGVVTVTVVADTADPPTYLPGTPAASVTVTDNDLNAFTIRFTDLGFFVDEDVGSVTVEIEFASASGRPPAGPVSVRVRTAGDSARPGQDFVAQSATVEMQPSDFGADGRATHELSIPIVDDTDFEAREQFQVGLSFAAAPHESDSASLASPPFTAVFITDNDLPAVTVEADPAPVAEGTDAAFTLRRSGITTAPLTVRVAVSETGAMLDGTPPDRVTFRAGSETATLIVETEDDGVDEDHSEVTVTVAASSAYVPGTPATASVTVTDDDVNEFTIALAQAAYSVPEDHGLLRVAIRFVSASGRPPAEPLSVTVRTPPDSARQIRDFVPQRAIFTAQVAQFDSMGRATAALFIPIRDDAEPEAAETFEVVLSNPVAKDAESDSVTLGTPAIATVTIVDNEPTGIAIRAVESPVEEGEAATFTLTRTRDTTEPLDVTVTVSESGDVLAAADEGLKIVTFAPGSFTATLSLETDDDAVDEADSVVTVRVDPDIGDLPAYVLVTPAAATVTVTDNDANEFAIAFAQASYPVDEDHGVLSVGIEFVSASGRPPAGPLSVSVEPRDGSARRGRDFSARETQVIRVRPTNFEMGRATATFYVPILNDSRSEAVETFDLDLSSPQRGAHESDNVTLGTPATATVTIADNDLPGITIEADAPSVAEGEAAAFTLTRTRAATETLTVNVRVWENGDMLAGAAPTTVTFLANALTAPLSLATEDDAADEADSEVRVRVVASSAYVPGTPAAASVTVTDDDANDFTIAFTRASYSVAEGAGSVNVGIWFAGTDDRGPDGPLSVTVATRADGAQAGQDFTARSVTAEVQPSAFSHGRATSNVSIPILDDTNYEGPESFQLVLSSPAAPHAFDSAGLGTPNTATVTIEDNDPPPAVTVAAVAESVAEGAEAAFTLTRTGAVTEAMTVGVRVRQEGDVLSGSAPDSVTFDANSATARLNLPTEDDAVDEADGAVTVTVAADRAVPIAYAPGTPAAASVTVTDDDPNRFAIAFGERTYSVDEGAGTLTVDVEFASTSGRPPETSVSVTVATQAGSAQAGQDFADRTETISVPPAEFDASGRATGAATITILDDADSEGPETFDLVLSSPGAAHESASAELGAPATATVTIEDDDLPAVTVAANRDSVPETTEIRFTLSRTGITMEALTVGVTVSETGTMLAGTPPDSVTFPARSAEAVLMVAIDNDLMTEDDSEVTVAVVADSADPATYRTGTPESAATMVQDNDLSRFTIAFTQASYSADEDDGTLAVGIVFESANNQPPDGQVSVTVATRDGSAQAGQDFTAQAVTVELQPGDFDATGRATEELSIPILDDAESEASETFEIVLSSPGAPHAHDEVSLGTPATATVTITDTDPLAVAVAADADSVAEGMVAAFTLTRNGDVTETLTVGVAVSEDGAMLAGSPPGSVTFEAGSATASLSLATEDDAVSEAHSVVTVTVVADSADPATYVPGTPGAASVTVTDNDVNEFTIAFGAASYSVAEDEGPLTAGIAFVSAIGRPPTGPLSVTVATRDGSARAGQDFTARSVTVEVRPGDFDATGRATQALSIPILDDADYEGPETFDLDLSSPGATHASDRASLGTPAAAAVTVTDDDAAEDDVALRASGAREWLVRFGRTATALVSETIGGRLSGREPEGDRLTIAGRAVPVSAGGASATPAIRPAFDDAPRDRADGHGGAQEVPPGSLMSASAFAFSQAREDGARWSFWGQGSGGRFSGEEGSLSFSGEVVSGAAGLEFAGPAALGGVAVVHGRGDGRYEHRLLRRPASKYDIEAHLTGVHPYVRFSPDRRTRVWGTFGFSRGSMSVKDPGGRHDGDISMLTGAAGASRQLLQEGGFDLKLRGDALGSRLESRTAPGLPAVEGGVFRVRAAMEAGHEREVGNGARLRPSLEAGLRYDGGDAETGVGLELGGGLELRNPARGVSVRAGGRVLAMHSDRDYRDWSVAGSVRLDPGTGGRGLALSLRPSYDTGGAERAGRLMREESFAGLESEGKPSGRVGLDIGYGLGAFGTGVLTPRAGMELDDAGARRYGTGIRLTLGGSLDLDVSSHHRFEGDDGHALRVRGSLRW